MRLLDLWADHHKVQIDFRRPGKPTDNSFVESFNGSATRRMPERETEIRIHGRRQAVDRSDGASNTTQKSA